jgi:hypothetical protein
MKETSKKSNDDYIADFKEWQDHQYTPGYFTGGRIPVWIKHPPRPRLLLVVFLLPILFVIGFLVIRLIKEPQQVLDEIDLGDLLSTVLLFIIVVVFVLIINRRKK